nr:ciliary opsin [Acutuncus antarcticus]QYF06565.1 ciliary opsin [Acutuncus antarcticus]
MILAMVIAFLIAWLPYTCVSIIVMAGGSHLLSPTATAVPAVFAKASLVYNPIIYALFNPQVWFSRVV